MATTEVSGFTVSLLRSVDDLDADAYLSHLTDDVRVRFGNGETLQGSDAVREMLNGHFATIERMHHEVVAEHRAGDVLIQEIMVTVQRKGGQPATVPGANILRLRDGLVEDYRVYIDLSPLDSA